MTENSTSGPENDTKRLAFMLSQLSSDLTDLAESLANGTLDKSTATQGARVQLEWALSQLPPTAVPDK